MLRRNFWYFPLLLLVCAFWTACGSSSSDGASSSNPSAPTPGPSADLASELVFCVDETNRYRTSVNRPPLGRSGTLETYAAAGAQQDGVAHVAHQHFTTTNGGGIALAENEIPWWGSSSVHTVIQQGLAVMWAEGPSGGHYQNIVGPYTQLGCGIFVNGSEITVVQDFR
jgi:uncharacterized protein YkwD